MAAIVWAQEGGALTFHAFVQDVKPKDSWPYLEWRCLCPAVTCDETRGPRDKYDTSLGRTCGACKKAVARMRAGK